MRPATVALLLLTSCGAAPVTVTHLRVRDPWQIDLEHVDGRVFLPPCPETGPRDCRSADNERWRRDERGFPLALAAGHFHFDEDGTLVATGTTPTSSHGNVRVVVALERYAVCSGRGHAPHPCTLPGGHMVFATPESNVMRLEVVSLP